MTAAPPPVQHKRRARPRWFYVVAPILVWLLLEGLSTGITRAFPEPPPPTLPEDDPSWLVSAKEAHRNKFFTLDEHTIWRPTPGYFEPPSKWKRYGTEPLIVDPNGHRVGPETPKKTVAKPPGVRRILLVGGSHPFGMWVNAGEAYIGVLERMLNAREPGGWETMNAASPGHTTFQGRKYIEEYALAFSPDIILFDLGMNDTLPLSLKYAAPDHEVQAVGGFTHRVLGVVEYSPTYRLLRRSLASVAGKPRPKQVRVPMERQLDNQRSVQALGKKEGFLTLFMSQVGVDQSGPMGGRARCKYRPDDFEPWVDICAAFEALGKSAGVMFHDPIHANKEGHALIARTVFDKLDSLGWTAPRTEAAAGSPPQSN